MDCLFSILKPSKQPTLSLQVCFSRPKFVKLIPFSFYLWVYAAFTFFFKVIYAFGSVELCLFE